MGFMSRIFGDKSKKLPAYLQDDGLKETRMKLVQWEQEDREAARAETERNTIVNKEHETELRARTEGFVAGLDKLGVLSEVVYQPEVLAPNKITDRSISEALSVYYNDLKGRTYEARLTYGALDDVKLYSGIRDKLYNGMRPGTFQAHDTKDGLSGILKDIEANIGEYKAPAFVSPPATLHGPSGL